MFFLGITKFEICALNQEKILWNLAKQVGIYGVKRASKKETCFCCDFLKKRLVKKFLLGNGVVIKSEKDFGILPYLFSLLTNFGFVASFVIFLFVLIFSEQFVLQHKVFGLNSLSESEIVEFLQDNVSANKNLIDCENVETLLLENFEKLSFASCIVKGQTLVVNVKEKLHPDSIFGDFLPILADKNCKITQIDLVSGTAKVKVGDYVKKGDVLVEPYTIDTDGNVKTVKASATILAQVYNEGFSEHFSSYYETYRTGNVIECDKISLFGLTIYSNEKSVNFDMFEMCSQEIKLAKNNILPLVLTKIFYYETKKRLMESDFEDVKEQFVEKARQNTLKNCENCDKIIDEYYVLKQMESVTIVQYCIVTQENVGVYYEN